MLFCCRNLIPFPSFLLAVPLAATIALTGGGAGIANGKQAEADTKGMDRDSAAFSPRGEGAGGSAADTHIDNGSSDDSGGGSLGRYLQFDDSPAPLSCLLTYFPPLVIQHGNDLQEFVRSRAFAAIRRRFGDRRAADALFIRAMQMTDNNTAISLFLSLAASLEHRTIELKIPFFKLAFPLTNESAGDFLRRIRNLPARLYSDSPPDPAGDKDKLQHFFGSAFLAFIFESRGPADRVGTFIEEGEEAIIVGETADPRDERANRQGQRFGLALLDDTHRLPSQFFKNPRRRPPLVAAPPGAGQRCIGVW